MGEGRGQVNTEARRHGEDGEMSLGSWFCGDGVWEIDFRHSALAVLVFVVCWPAKPQAARCV